MLSGVSKTAILTLRARVDEHDQDDGVLDDPLAKVWWSKITWPTELDDWYQPAVQQTLAFRADDIDHIIRRYAESAPPLTIVELGCGLSTRRDRLANLDLFHWVDVDLPEVVTLRQSWGVGDDRHTAVGASVLDETWMDRVPKTESPPLFIAEGLFYYLPRSDVDVLLEKIRNRFPGSILVMDVLGDNDYLGLLKHTQAVGTPIQWKLETDFANVLFDFQLTEVSEFEPDRLTHEMLTRYWSRFSPTMQGGIYMAMHSDLIWPGRSGTIVGRLD